MGGAHACCLAAGIRQSPRRFAAGLVCLSVAEVRMLFLVVPEAEDFESRALRRHKARELEGETSARHPDAKVGQFSETGLLEGFRDAQRPRLL